MSILGGMTTDYGQDTGAFIVGSMITKGLFAINDLDPSFNPVDLQIGTNGSINFVVGTDNNPDKPDKTLSLIDNYKGASGIYNFQVYGSNAIALSPADPQTTVYVGDAVFYSDTEYVYLTSYTKKLALMTDEIELGGSLHSLQDMKVEGEIYAPELNITKNLEDNNLLGYAFRISADNVLELVKYMNTGDPDSNAAQLVAHFGKGDIVNDPQYSFNSYSSSLISDSQLVGNNELVGPNEQQASGGGGGGYWIASSQGNDIYYGTEGGSAQRVGINTSSPDAELDVIGTVKASELTDGYIRINNGFLHNINSIEVNAEGQYAGIKFKNIDTGVNYYWNGKASTIYQMNQLTLSFFQNDLYLDDFYTGTNRVWFDNPQETIRLSQFSNDILDFGGDVTFCNCTVTETFTVTNQANLLGGLDVNTMTTNTISNTGRIDTNQIKTSTAEVSGILTVGNEIDVPSIKVGLDITCDALTADSNIQTNTVEASIINTSQVNADHSVTAPVMNVTTQLNVSNRAFAVELQTEELKTDKVIGDLIPDVDSVYDLGSFNKKWRDLYLSGNTLNIDNVEMKVDGTADNKRLRLIGGSFGLERLSFDDGTAISSINDIYESVNEGDTFGDFSGFTMILNNKRLTVEQFSGSYIYNSAHNIAVSGTKWNVRDFTSANPIFPIKSDGSGVDLSQGTLIKQGTVSKDVQISFINKRQFLSDNVFYGHETESNPNNMFPLRNFDPFSERFKFKAKSDFHYFYNNMVLEEGNKTGGETMYFDTTNTYVQINNVNTFNSRNSGNKFYDVEILYYHNTPVYESKYIVDNMTNMYITSTDPVARLDSAYVYDEDAETYVLSRINNEYGLYPKIAIKKWDNSVNATEFSEVIYTDDMGWGDPDEETTFNRFNSLGWIRVLYETTYKYIKYGYVIGDFPYDPVLNNIDAYVSNLTYNDITFISENNILATDGTEIENDTIFCLKKTVFQSLI